jgi:hypothetical protein
MSKVKCDICGIDLNKSGLAHHKKTKKHLIEEAKKYNKFDFSTGQIIQNGGISTKPLEEISLNIIDEPFLSETKLKTSNLDIITFKRLDPNLSKKEKNTLTLNLLDDFMKNINPKPYFVEQLRKHIETFDKII